MHACQTGFALAEFDMAELVLSRRCRICIVTDYNHYNQKPRYLPISQKGEFISALMAMTSERHLVVQLIQCPTQGTICGSLPLQCARRLRVKTALPHVNQLLSSQRSKRTTFASLSKSFESNVKSVCCCRNLYSPHPGTRHLSFPFGHELKTQRRPR